MATLKEKIREAVITNCDPKLNPTDVLEDTFKFVVAEMLKTNIQQNKNRIAAGFIQALCAHLINEFHGADLGDYQKPETWYANLFNKTIQEILNDASHVHAGENKVEVSKEHNFSIKSGRDGWNMKNGLLVRA